MAESTNPNTINPIATGFTRDDRSSDPFVREAYFGSPDTPGIISQAISAANKSYGTPFQAQGVAGFSPFANRAMEGAYAGIGGYKPYLGAYEDALRQGMDTIGQRKGLINEALGATRQSGEIQQPYFAQAEKQLQDGMQNLASSYGRQGPSARDYQRASLQGFDPRSASAYELPSQFMLPFVSSARGQTAEGINALMGGAVREQQMGTRALGELQRGVGQDQAYRKRGLRELTGAGDEARMIAREIGRSTFDPRDTSRFYDPFEDRVVQQTIDDAFKQSDIQDVAQRARDIQSGGESAFGSRARLTADERRASLGRGLGEALAGIRSGGFQRAQDSALGEFGRQQSALERSGSQLAGLGQTIGSGFDRFGAGQLGSSQLLAGQIRGLGSAAADRAAQEQAARFGAASSEIGIGSNLAGLSEQALQNAISESRFGRGALERAGSFEAGLGRDVQGARRGYSSDLLGIGGQRGNLARNISGDIRGISGDIGGIGQDIAGYGRAYGDLGQEYQRLGQGERSELMQYDQASRNMKQAGIDAQYTADERNRFAPTQAASYVQGFLPQYTPGFSNVQTTYGAPVDPLSQGLGTFMNTYANFAGSQNPNTTQGGGGNYTT